MTVCLHHLGDLPCVNTSAHEGNGRGCVHESLFGSAVDDRHSEGGHG